MYYALFEQGLWEKLKKKLEGKLLAGVIGLSPEVRVCVT